MQPALAPVRAPSSNASERDLLIARHAEMVRRIAYRMARRLPPSVDADDLVSIGMIGLIDAVDRYEDARAPSFTAYALLRVKGAMIDEMRKQDWVPRSVRDRAETLDRTRRELRSELGRAPERQEVASRLGVDVARVAAMEGKADVATLVSLDQAGDDEVPLSDTLKTEDENPEQIATRRAASNRVRSVLADLPERDRLLVDLYYYRELNFKEIATILGVTESRVSQLHTRIKNTLQARMIDLDG